MSDQRSNFRNTQPVGGGWGRRSQGSSSNPPNFAAALLAALLLLPLVTAPIADEFTAKYVASHAPPGAYTDKDIQDAVDYFNRQRQLESEPSTHKKPAAAGGGWGGRLQGSHPPSSQPAASGGGWGVRSQLSNGTRRDDPAENINKVYVTGFPHFMTTNQLRLIFIEMGFREVNVTLNTRGLKPFAFVTFRSQEDATRALAASGCTFIEDGESFKLTVSPVREKTQFGTGRGGGEAAYPDLIPAAAGGGAVGGRWGNHHNQSSQSPPSQQQQPAPAQQPVQQPAHSQFSIEIQKLLMKLCFVDESVAQEFAETYVSSHAPPSGEYTDRDVRYACEFYKRQPFIEELAKDLKKLDFVTHQKAMEFAYDYAMSSKYSKSCPEHTRRLHSNFRKIDVTIATDVFKSMVSKDIYSLIGCPKHAIDFHLLPPFVQKKVLQAVPPEPTGTHAVPNFFLYMLPSYQELSDLENHTQGIATAILSCAIVTESGILMDPTNSHKKNPVMIFPDRIGRHRPDRFAIPVTVYNRDADTNDDRLVEAGLARTYSELTSRNKSIGEINADPTLMGISLKEWTEVMSGIATPFCVSFPAPEPVAQATAAVLASLESSESSESYRICKHGNFLNDGFSPCQECLSNVGKDPIKDGWGETLGYRK